MKVSGRFVKFLEGLESFVESLESFRTVLKVVGQFGRFPTNLDGLEIPPIVGNIYPIPMYIYNMISVPNGYPIPDPNPKFFSIPDPYPICFQNHRVFRVSGISENYVFDMENGIKELQDID